MNGTQDQEQWRAIPGFEGHYEVSDQGNVRSLDRIINRGRGRYLYGGRPIAPYSAAGTAKKRYAMVRLGRDGKKFAHYVHHLVALAFIGPRPDGSDVRHLNDVQTDNRLANLAYGTRAENVADMLKNTGHHFGDRTHCKHGHEYTPENTDLRVVNPRSVTRICVTCRRNRAKPRTGVPIN